MASATSIPRREEQAEYFVEGLRHRRSGRIGVEHLAQLFVTVQWGLPDTVWYEIYPCDEKVKRKRGGLARIIFESLVCARSAVRTR